MLEIIKIELKWSKLIKIAKNPQNISKYSKSSRSSSNGQNRPKMLKIAKNHQNISKCSKIIKIELKWSKSTKNAPKSSKSSSNPPKSRQTLRISAKAAPPSRPRLPSKSLQIAPNPSKSHKSIKILKIDQKCSIILQTELKSPSNPLKSRNFGKATPSPCPVD